MRDDHYDVILVGSGIASLTAAVLLAKQGKRVCVLEKYRKPGGYLHSFKRFGFQFETGAHYIGALKSGQPFHRLLSYMNVYRPDLFIPLREIDFDTFHFPDFKWSLSQSYERTIENLSAQFPREGQAIRTYFDSVRKTAAEFPTYSLQTEYDTKRVEESLSVSLDSYCRALTNNSQLLRVFYSHCTLHGVEPKDVAFGLHAVLTDSLILSSFGLKRGGDAWAQSFVEALEHFGGEIKTSCPATGFILDGKSITHVETPLGTLSADIFISGTHPKTTFRLIPESALSPLFRQRLKGLDESGGIFGIYLVVDEKFEIDPLANHYHFESSRLEPLMPLSAPDAPGKICYLSMTQRFVPVGPRPLTIHTQCHPEWFERWRNTSWGRRPLEYQQFKQEITDRTLQFLETRYPKLSQSILHCASSSPLSNVHFNGSEGGSGYGIYHSMKNTGPRSLGPRTHLKNLYLTGQSTLFPGLLGAAISGLRVAGHVVGIKPLIEEIQGASV